MHFHGYEHMALAALEDIRSKKPEEFDDARKIYDHYCGSEAGKDFARAYASLRFILRDSYPAAEADILRAQGRGIGGSTTLLIKDCINEGGLLPSMKSEDYFYKKGLIRDEKNYYATTRGFEYDSPYHNACRSVLPQYRPVLKRAVHFAFAKVKDSDDIKISKKILEYIPAQLMPAGHERDFRLNALSHQNTGPAHKDLLNQSRTAVLAIAGKLSIVFGKDQLVGEAMRSAPEPTPKQRLEALKANLSRRTFEHRTAQITVEPANENKSLMRELTVMASKGAITKEEGRIYLWLHDMSEHRVHKDAARHFNKTEKAVVAVDSKVGLALTAYRNDLPVEKLLVKR